MTNLKEVFEFLRDNGYILASKGKYSFSNKFYQDKEKIKEENLPVPPVMMNPARILQEQFIDFIGAAKVPRRLETNRGDSYDVNKYSEEAAKVFGKMMAEGIDLKLLLRTTQLYYASGTGYKKKIGNYIIDGDWRTDYLALKNADSPEELTNHIKDELDHGHNPYSF